MISLKGKTVVLGVTGSVACFKACSLASLLVKSGAEVHVIMTKNAINFINPIQFESLTKTKCLTDTFDRDFEFDVKHISLAKKADCFVVAPATANFIAKAANGIADDMLTTTFLAATCKKIISPAMNTAMLENPVTQDNISRCRKYGMEITDSATGLLACGDVGKGKMLEPEQIMDYIIKAVTPQDLQGKKVLVTAGPTQESLDPVRFITNHSSGKMGYSIAKMAAFRGAEVKLISGPVNLKAPSFVELCKIQSAADMFNAITDNYQDADIIIKAAAVADYTPENYSDQKIKKSGDDMAIPLQRTQDILAWLGNNRKPGTFLCGFSMETQDMVENSRKKLEKKNLDMICANNLKVDGAGFGVDTNIITLIGKDFCRELPLLSKEDAANAILDTIIELNGNRQ